MKKVLLIMLIAIMLVLVMSTVAYAAEDVGAVDTGQSEGGVIAVALFMAVLVELILERLKGIFEKKPPAWMNNVLAILLGVGLCLWFGIDMLSAFGIHSVFVSGGYIGVVATGILIGGGSGFMHVALDRLRSSKAKSDTE